MSCRTRTAGLAALLGIGLAAAAAGQDAPSPGSQADEHHDPEAMEAARRALRRHHGGQWFWFVEAEQLELRAADGDTVGVGDFEGYFGGDRNKLWIKTDAGYHGGGSAEVQVLWSRAVTPFFDVQGGLYGALGDASGELGHDSGGRGAVLGLHGLAPYWFEVEAALHVGSEGRTVVHLDVAYDLLWTRRLILEPRAILDLVVRPGEAGGASEAEAGLRLRYEIDPQFAPYAGIVWERGGPVESAGAGGGFALVAGLRLWY